MAKQKVAEEFRDATPEELAGKRPAACTGAAPATQSPVQKMMLAPVQLRVSGTSPLGEWACAVLDRPEPRLPGSLHQTYCAEGVFPGTICAYRRDESSRSLYS